MESNGTDSSFGPGSAALMSSARSAMDVGQSRVGFAPAWPLSTAEEEQQHLSATQPLMAASILNGLGGIKRSAGFLLGKPEAEDKPRQAISM